MTDRASPFAQQNLADLHRRASRLESQRQQLARLSLRLVSDGGRVAACGDVVFSSGTLQAPHRCWRSECPWLQRANPVCDRGLEDISDLYHVTADAKVSLAVLVPGELQIRGKVLLLPIFLSDGGSSLHWKRLENVFSKECSPFPPCKSNFPLELFEHANLEVSQMLLLLVTLLQEELKKVYLT